MRKGRKLLRNTRGVALIIVLLVTALLIALIFEFAYGTRVSLRAAANYRNSQRAYFIARSGFGVFVKYPELRDMIPQGEWSVIPYISEGDTELRMRWEDEKGKINISILDASTARGKSIRGWIYRLFTDKGISQEIADKMAERGVFNRVEDLHQIMSDEDYGKIEHCFTVYSGIDGRVNINTASDDVLRSLGIDPILVAGRKENPITNVSAISGISSIQTEGQENLINYLDVSSNYYKIFSFATVGGYTKQVVAVVDLAVPSPRYWRAL